MKYVKLFENFLLEKEGLHDDVKILAEFLYQELKNSELKDSESKKSSTAQLFSSLYNRKVFTKKQLPLLSTNIAEIIVDRVPDKKTKDALGAFNFGSSRRDEDGNTLFFYLPYKVSKSTIYHEVNHSIRFCLNKNFNLDPYYASTTVFGVKSLNNLTMKFYFSSEEEILSRLTELHEYIDSYNAQEINQKTLLKKIHTLYKNAQELKSYNIFNDYSVLNDRNYTIFSILYDDFIKKDVKNARHYVNYFSELSPQKIEEISKKYNPESVTKMMLKMCKHINSQGERFIRKMFKIIVSKLDRKTIEELQKNIQKYHRNDKIFTAIFKYLRFFIRLTKQYASVVG